MQKILIIIGVIFIIAGLLFPFWNRLGFGHLPGDILIKRDNFTFYFPLTTCIIISIVLTLLLAWLRHK
jgi:formate hydrogenlyase subunit 3/multisubunit Na+/H+ antiporter MnhD subunit